MIYRTHIPQPPLSDFVDLFWLREGYQPAHAKERVLPTGTIELVINLSDDVLRVYDRQDQKKFQTFRGCVVSGAQSEFVVIDTACQAAVMGVHFKPGGAFPFFGLPASELQDSQVSLELLWGRTADDLRNRLLEAKTPASRFEILEQSLMVQAARRLARHPAVVFALAQFQSAPRTIREVNEQIGLSPRRFIQVFSEEVGLNPKLFCRILRLQEVVRVLQNKDDFEWAQVAAACGYYDQAHFIHDFRAFSGFNPSDYVNHRTESLNHALL
jgi:AraC-like DNA-binding protein